MQAFRWAVVLILFWGTFLSGAASGGAASALAVRDGLEAHQVKAAFLYRFAQFVEWPADANKPNNRVELCLIGTNPFGDAVFALDGKLVGGLPFRVREVLGVSPLEVCHLLFVSESEAARLDDILSACEHAQVLTIADMEGFAERGGMIGLVTVNRRVRFDIHLGAARAAGLELDSRLLRLARHVYGVPKGGAL